MQLTTLILTTLLALTSASAIPAESPKIPETKCSWSSKRDDCGKTYNGLGNCKSKCHTELYGYPKPGQCVALSVWGKQECRCLPECKGEAGEKAVVY
ncbi:hypothetical protein HBI65_049390 [Parastagonospora nodorum]|nr:hypothetical protein HBI75_021600 [Parastagonospora nodorum]KAH5094410.1 hypothetical protein HBH72_166590 [Parastagonospora nodorum]KAH5357316.1 hypothetical protein HBI48_122180 [Parastagonospora nodorum]KAH5386788.1 hypothetical protein HBI33_073310 [Parastagonospora nodorum]KAH6103134.1 hypothetical protein HBI65_049390 [Parastagonospora nodorum]